LSVATVAPSSDGRMTSACPSLLGATVVTGVFCPSLLCYHYSDVLVATVRLPMATMTYDLLLHYLFVVVLINMDLAPLYVVRGRTMLI
jgi:hypothetical protein